MKKILLSFIAVAVSATMMAQTDVEQNSTHPFSVAVNNGVSVGATGYAWSADAALGATFNNTNTNSVEVTFAGPLTTVGNVSVSATSDAPELCSGDAVSRSFRIVNRLSLGATLPALSAICPLTTTNTSGGDIPSFIIGFNDNAATPADANVTQFSYQVVAPDGTPAGIVTVPAFAAANNFTLDLATAYDNTATGTYTIRLVMITDGTTTVNYPDASGNYPQTTIDVHLAPELTF